MGPPAGGARWSSTVRGLVGPPREVAAQSLPTDAAVAARIGRPLADRLVIEGASAAVARESLAGKSSMGSIVVMGS